MSLCARTFGAVFQLAGLNLSIFQDAVSIATHAPELHQFLPNAVAYLFDMTADEHKEMEGYRRWYHEMIEYAVFGTEDDPIIIDE